MPSTIAFRHTSYKMCGISDWASLGGNPGNPRSPRKPIRKPFHLSAGTPHRALTNISGGRSTGTKPLAHSRPLEGLLRQIQDDDVLLVAAPVVVGEVRQALPSRCNIIRMKSQSTRGTNARLLPCLCVPGVFSHRTSPGASARKSNRKSIVSDSDSFILVVRFGAGCERASNVQQNERKQLMQQNECK